MKAFFRGLAAVAIGMVAPREAFAADAAASDNYQLTSVSIDAGGVRNSSTNYVNDVAIGMIAYRGLAPISVVNFVGYTATLNNPPIAFDDVLSHPFDQPVTIIPDSFLQNDLDQDADAIYVLNVDGTTQAQGSVAVGRASFIYTPPVSFNGIDRFNYRVIDAAGDVSEASVTMVVAPDVAAQTTDTIAIFKLSDGSYLVRFKYLKGFSEYHIETITDFGQEWQLLESIHAGGDGVASLIIRADEPRRFYRAVVF